MGNLVYRVCAVLVALAGTALLAFMMEATYRTSGGWDRMLLAIGMPLSFLLPLLGALMVAAGALMYTHAAQDGGHEPKDAKR
jgi:hypothetical protein